MNTLTICQPWCWAILHGPKKIENRTWPTNHRGPLLLHSGKSRKFLESEDPAVWPERYGVPLPEEKDLVFGAILGVVDVVDCLHFEDLPPDWKAHPFAQGPYCWLLANPRPFAEPIPWKGQLSLYQVPDEAVRRALAATVSRLKTAVKARSHLDV
jgi:hypothetical protein